METACETVNEIIHAFIVDIHHLYLSQVHLHLILLVVAYPCPYLPLLYSCTSPRKILFHILQGWNNMLYDQQSIFRKCFSSSHDIFAFWLIQYMCSLCQCELVKCNKILLLLFIGYFLLQQRSPNILKHLNLRAEFLSRFVHQTTFQLIIFAHHFSCNCSCFRLNI